MVPTSSVLSPTPTVLRYAIAALALYASVLLPAYFYVIVQDLYTKSGAAVCGMSAFTSGPSEGSERNPAIGRNPVDLCYLSWSSMNRQRLLLNGHIGRACLLRDKISDTLMIGRPCSFRNSPDQQNVASFGNAPWASHFPARRIGLRVLPAAADKGAPQKKLQPVRMLFRAVYAVWVFLYVSVYLRVSLVCLDAPRGLGLRISPTRSSQPWHCCGQN